MTTTPAGRIDTHVILPLRELTRAMLPEVKRLGLARFCDVFCDAGAFTVKPLTSGRMKSDKGRVIMGGAAFGETVRNGMKVWEMERRPSLDGQRGRLVVEQRFDTHEMQNGMRVGVGTWKIKGGTGAYSRITGGGRYVAVSMTNGRTIVRQEGWVTITG